MVSRVLEIEIPRSNIRSGVTKSDGLRSERVIIRTKGGNLSLRIAGVLDKDDGRTTIFISEE